MDGVKGCIADMRELGIWDTFQVKSQTIKTAIESACMLLRIDDIVSGMQKKLRNLGHCCLLKLLFIFCVIFYHRILIVIPQTREDYI